MGQNAFKCYHPSVLGYLSPIFHRNVEEVMLYWELYPTGPKTPTLPHHGSEQRSPHLSIDRITWQPVVADGGSILDL